jgi:hypothetical protein
MIGLRNAAGHFSCDMYDNNIRKRLELHMHIHFAIMLVLKHRFIFVFVHFQYPADFQPFAVFRGCKEGYPLILNRIAVCMDGVEIVKEDSSTV